MREVPLESNTEALSFADGVMLGEFDMVVLLTGVGARALIEIVERVRGDREPFLRALRETTVVARGPKPLAVMRELNVPVWLTAPEPNTWRELLAALDARAGERPLTGLRLAVQEYGASNEDLLAGLRDRGAQVTARPGLPVGDARGSRAAAAGGGGPHRRRDRRDAVHDLDAGSCTCCR